MSSLLPRTHGRHPTPRHCRCCCHRCLCCCCRDLFSASWSCVHAAHVETVGVCSCCGRVVWIGGGASACWPCSFLFAPCPAALHSCFCSFSWCVVLDSCYDACSLSDRRRCALACWACRCVACASCPCSCGALSRRRSGDAGQPRSCGACPSAGCGAPQEHWLCVHGWAATVMQRDAGGDECGALARQCRHAEWEALSWGWRTRSCLRAQRQTRAVEPGVAAAFYLQHAECRTACAEVAARLWTSRVRLGVVARGHECHRRRQSSCGEGTGVLGRVSAVLQSTRWRRRQSRSRHACCTCSVGLGTQW